MTNTTTTNPTTTTEITDYDAFIAEFEAAESKVYSFSVFRLQDIIYRNEGLLKFKRKSTQV